MNQGNEQLANTKIVCIGDSYTYGYPGETKDSWPEKLVGILKIEVVNAGKVYQNTEDLLGAV
jgi:lysophospholipase L1-like esterase